MIDDTRDGPEQAGAIPWRWRDSRLEMLLITSSHARRWIVPKGWIEEGDTARETARNETFEEAGVGGILSAAPIGQLDYKRGDRVLRVELFSVQVTEIHAHWPEAHRRERMWLEAREAAATADEPGLAHLIRVLESRLLEETHDSGTALAPVLGMGAEKLKS